MSLHEFMALPAQSDMALLPPLMGFSESEEIPALLPVLCRMFIACSILRFEDETRFSALVFLHRYALAIPKDDNLQPKSIRDWRWVAGACLFLACKAEEEPRRLRDVINLSHMLFADEGKGNSITISETPPDLDEEYWEAKRTIVDTEQIVLRWLGFDLSVSHPHRAVLLLLEKESDRDKLIPAAFCRLNDALFDPNSLCHSVLELACASIELAEEDVQLVERVSKKNDWCSAYNIRRDDLGVAKSRLKHAASKLKRLQENEDFCDNSDQRKQPP
eukprot:scaffold7703_cov127-Cylindrotheca_fusiformis.AAC.13